MPLNVQKVKWGHLLSTGGGSLHAPAGHRSGHAGRGGDPDAAFAQWILSPPVPVPARSMRPGLQAVLFDLDGVLVDTAEFHYLAWQRLADELGLDFDRQANEAFRGVPRMECLDKLLGEHVRSFAVEEKVILAERKNRYYLDLVKKLAPRDVAAGGRELLAAIRRLPADQGEVRIGIVSASKNARLVLELLNLISASSPSDPGPFFDAIIDGTDKAKPKPDPAPFLLAAERLRVEPGRCIVIEDAEAGIRAAKSAGMKAIGLGPCGAKADVAIASLSSLSASRLEQLMAPSAKAHSRA